ncbi:nSTAND1 domain-containing NTPase [Amycolatopsis sp. CA-126428]|uniref:nSTAND1 domain-containing NTPase n=1 Tax=Amycolatopsis sp. CA-126428 TaxID=2073158 RepID=UPI000CD0C876|nr:WD40 repeat domain-containing protein [Amycolatopsis sp. CA-126428]
MGDHNRRLIAIAIPDAAASAAFQDGVAAQLAAVEAWWCAPELGDRVFALRRIEGIDSRRDFETAVHDAGLRRLAASDVALVYLTGHGKRGPSGRHYLLLPDTPHGRLPGHAYPTADVVAAVLDSDVRHVLVIVNSCFSGSLEAELGGLREDLTAERRGLTSVSVFVSADFDEMPRVREFAELLERLREWLRTKAEYTAPFLTFDEFEKELVDAARRAPRLLEPRRVWRTGPSDEPSPCLPNPGYRPPDDVVSPARRQVATSAGELDYWLDRASGRLSGDDPGWYFAGRQQLTGQVADFLREGRGTLIVTGAAGTGKSAIIARAVTLSDPAFLADPRYSEAVTSAPPETVPPPGAVDVAVLARNKSVDEVVDQLLAAFGCAGPGSRESLRELLEREDMVRTIVVDGVDEARTPALLVVDVLGPLARLTDRDGRHRVRLVAGVRSSRRTGADPAEPELVDLLRQSADEVVELRTDGAETEGAIAQYVEALLSEKEPAYRTAVASVVANRVAPSFLDARLAGQRLREVPAPQRIDDRQWLASLDEGTVGLLRQDLLDAQTPQHSAGELLAVLQAAAFARGGGIPWADVWPAVAAAVLGQADAEDDLDGAIAHVIGGRLCGYLARDSEDGRSVYRPAHERLAQVLREDPERILDSVPVSEGRVPHGRIAERLSDLARRAPGLPPHPYLRRHLVDHAALGGVLDDQIVFPAFLPWDTGGHVRGLLGLPVTDAPGKAALSAWGRIEPFLGDADQPSRALALRLSQLATGATSAVDPVAEASRTIALRPRWAHWTVLGNVVASLPSQASALTAFPGPDGKALLAIATYDGTVGVRDPDTGRAVGEPLPGDATALAAFTGPGGRSLLAIGGRRGAIRVWDPATGRLIARPLTGHTSSINAVHALRAFGRTLLATASQDETVRLWDLATGLPFGAPLVGHTGGVRAVTSFSTRDGKVRLATGSWDQTIRVWDVAGGRPAGRPMTGHIGAVNSVLALPAEGLLASCGADGTVRVWVPEGTGRRIETHGGGVQAVAGFTADGQDRLVTVDLDGTFRTWTTWGTPVGEPMTGTTDRVTALTTFTSRAGRLVLATGDRDGTVRLWDLAAPPATPVDGVNAVTEFRDHGGRRLLAGAGDNGAVRVWDAGTGELMRTLTSDRDVTWSVAAVRGRDGRTLLATAADVPAIRIWDFGSGELVRTLDGHTSGVEALVVVPGRPWLASGSRDCTVRVWDADTGAEVMPAMTSHTDSVNALVTFRNPSG